MELREHELTHGRDYPQRLSLHIRRNAVRCHAFDQSELHPGKNGIRSFATHHLAQFLRFGDCGRSAHSIRATASQLRLLVVLMIVPYFQCPFSLGQTPASVNVQVGHDFWTFKDGAPADVACLAQTNDGFLWLGGPNGLFRFDGTRFEPFSSPFADRLLSTDLESLFAPHSGGLWIGYIYGGFSFLDKGRVANYASQTGTVFGFAQDRNGVVWATTSNGLWRFDHSGWQHIGVEWNIPAGSVTKVGFDQKGILWALAGSIGTPLDLIYLLPGTRHFKTAERNLSIDGFLLDADRTVVTDTAAPPMSGSSKDSEERPAAYPVLTKNSQQFLDRNKSLWVSYNDKPIVMRLPKERLHFDPNGASPAGSETYGIYPYDMAQLVDREGDIWFGDTKGIHRLFYSPLNKPEFPKEASENADFAVAADENGAVWISSRTDIPKADLFYVSGGKAQRRLQQITTSFAYRAPDRTLWFSGKDCLWHLVGKKIARVNLPPEMVNQYFSLQAITQDEQGAIWISFGGLPLYQLANGRWRPYGGRDDFPKKSVLISEYTDSLGRVWFGYTKSQLAVLDGDRVRVFGPGDGLQVGNITAIYGRGPEIWIGGEFGLEQFDKGRFHKITAMDDEWLRGTSGIVETANGDLWLNAISGIFHIRKAEISAALKDPNYRVKGEHFGRRDGLPGIAAQLRPLPTAIEGTDGRLWFTLRNGVVWLDPSVYSEKRTVPPSITIQSVSADDKFYAPDPHLSLPARTSSVQISYAAVSLSDPEAIRFRYKLHETDKDWHEAAAATPIIYRNLPPGSYHFSVEPSDTNGVWSGAPANIAFTIPPAFYQALWFRGLCVLVFFMLLRAGYQMRVHQLQEQEKKFRDAVETMPALAFVADPKGNRTFLNRGWLEYTGLNSEQASGSGWEVAVHPDDLKRVTERWSKSQATGEPLDYEARLRRGSDGAYRWFQTRARPLRNNRGKIVKWCAVATDIQDRKRAEQLQADLAHTNRVSMLGELAASISHELKQPISAAVVDAQASLRWLNRDQPDLDQARRATAAIVKDGRLAVDIIDRLRSLYKKTPPQREPVDVDEIIGEMVLLLRSEANEHAVSIRTDPAADLPKITADRVQVQQVLMNLMLNGIEAMRETGGVLTVKTARGECSQVLISVSDTGVGLPAGSADDIFNAFFTTKSHGSGMGLAISRSIVESHGGRLWATSNDGRGATFHFTLPIAPAKTNSPVDAT
jgi:PAS domain S-box-containing protein